MNAATKSIILAILCTLFTSTGQILWKLGSKNVTNVLSVFSNSVVLLGFFFYGCGALLLIFALKKGDLSRVYPLIALSFVWVQIASVLIFHESSSIVNWLGIVAILGGVIFVTRGGS